MNSYKAMPLEWDCSIRLSSVPRSGEPYVESFELPLDGVIEHWGQSYVSRGPVHAMVEASYTGERILARVSVRAEFSLPCSRCLSETGVAIMGDLRYLFSLRSSSRENGERDSDEEMGSVLEEDGDVDVIPVDSFQSELDLSQYVWEVLLLNLPERVICADDCKGLCPVCGQNRNEVDCGCVEDDTDPRFAVLRGLQS